MKYTVFDKTTGKIKKIVTCTEEMIALQLHDENDDYLEGESDDRKQVVDLATNKVVDLPEETIQGMEQAEKEEIEQATVIRSKMDEILRAMAIEAIEKEKDDETSTTK